MKRFWVGLLSWWKILSFMAKVRGSCLMERALGGVKQNKNSCRSNFLLLSLKVLSPGGISRVDHGMWKHWTAC